MRRLIRFDLMRLDEGGQKVPGLEGGNRGGEGKEQSECSWLETQTPHGNRLIIVRGKEEEEKDFDLKQFFHLK